ncbi:US33A [Human betaherpesvirus 5]|uniref:Protein US33A n=3 Tax=Human cytomegalovirus TaxID=10359 RepID=V9PUP5_HCMV|nr:protein US33A [Human betaherpesvirus 5]AFP95706.1 protein US33A [Human betaherpesvirus 5]AFR55491.1 protein US33A [Human betaherpesvirus 5]AHB19807.1 protein US33A [Human betaherpesvirus 5]AHJ85758.1 protein US33A [Human betaherpesvirus 5]
MSLKFPERVGYEKLGHRPYTKRVRVHDPLGLTRFIMRQLMMYPLVLPFTFPFYVPRS